MCHGVLTKCSEHRRLASGVCPIGTWTQIPGSPLGWDLALLCWAVCACYLTQVAARQTGRRGWSATLWPKYQTSCCARKQLLQTSNLKIAHPKKPLSLPKTSLKRGEDTSRQVCFCDVGPRLLHHTVSCNPKMWQKARETWRILTFPNLPAPDASFHESSAGFWVTWASIPIVNYWLTPSVNVDLSNCLISVCCKLEGHLLFSLLVRRYGDS